MRKHLSKITALNIFREIWKHFGKVQEMTEQAVSRTIARIRTTRSHTNLNTFNPKLPS